MQRNGHCEQKSCKKIQIKDDIFIKHSQVGLRKNCFLGKNNNDSYQKLEFSSVHIFIIAKDQIIRYTNNGFILHSDILYINDIEVYYI